MAAIANGLAAYSPGTIIPITSSFFMFYLYAAPAVRMGALQKIPVIHVATHDSIGAGEDGPTHQPVELAVLYRAMPNMHYIRPADSEEVAGAWEAAVNYKQGPSMISVSRHALPQTGLTKRAGVKKGAYVVKEEQDAEVTLISVGAELHFAIKVAEQLPVKARVVSFPSHALFRQQSKEYQRSVLRRNENIPSVVIEPYVSLGVSSPALLHKRCQYLTYIYTVGTLRRRRPQHDYLRSLPARQVHLRLLRLQRRGYDEEDRDVRR